MNTYVKKLSRLRCFLGLMILIPLLAVADELTMETSGEIERVLWNNTPIAVQLQVGKERLLRFPESISVGVPQGLATVLRSQSINGTVYLTAHQSFDTTRVIVRAEPAGPIYVLDLSATVAEQNSPLLPTIHIMVAYPQSDNSVSGNAAAAIPRWGYVALTRFAAQQLYAPARLLNHPPGLVRVPVTNTAIDLVAGWPVEAIPVAAWRAGRHTVTAVRLKNTSQQAVVLDPRQLRGAWLTATFQHNRLLAAGDEADSTAVYLIADRPFEMAF